MTNFDVGENNLIGTIPSNIDQNSLEKILLSKNFLTGTIPLEFSKLKNLRTLRLANNLLTGTIPSNPVELTHLENLSLENNNLKGNVPYEDCGQFAFLSCDCNAPKNIKCKCCTHCFGAFSTYEDILPCPSSELSVIYNTAANDLIYIYLQNLNRQQILTAYYFSDPGKIIYNSCISPTDCFTLDSSSDAPFSLYVDNKPIVKDISKDSTTIDFGYTSESSMQLDTCGDVVICDKILNAASFERKLFNLIIKFEGMDVFKNENSAQYMSLCWWLDSLDTMLIDESENEALIQRYILSLLYYSADGTNWFRQNYWLNDESECDWYGVSCDIYPGIVTKIDLSSNNLVGSIPSELGQLRTLEELVMHSNHFYGNLPKELVNLKTLKTLKLSKNDLQGTLPTEIKYLANLKEVDLSGNKFSGTLPVEISSLIALEVLNLSNNELGGTIPENFNNLKKLRKVSIKNNLLRGNIDMFESLTNLDTFDVSHNYLTGTLFLGRNQQNLKVAYLNNNKFSGSIASTIGELKMVQELILSSNKLTGSIPSTIGLLKQLVNISLSYNRMKGAIPTEVSLLTNLNLLHLHSNRFEGSANHIKKNPRSFITDCAPTETVSALVECSGCTECCNIDGDCIVEENTWPRSTLKSFALPPAVIIMLSAVIFSIVVSLIIMILIRIEIKLPALPYKVKSTFQEGSVYSFYLSSNVSSWFFASCSVTIQLFIIYLFIQSGVKDFPGNLVVYSVSCPNDNLQCDDHSLLNSAGYITVGIILAAYLLPRILDGILLVYQSTVERDMKGVIAGLIVLNVATLTIVASFIHLKASSISNIVMIKDIVVVLFINAIDACMYIILSKIFPVWLEKVENDSNRNKIDSYSERIASKKKELSIYCVKIDRKIKDIEQINDKTVNLIQSEFSKEITDYEAQTPPISDEYSIMQKMLEEKKAKMVNIREEVYRTYCNCKIQDRTQMNDNIRETLNRGDSKTAKITSIFKPRV